MLGASSSPSTCWTTPDRWALAGDVLEDVKADLHISDSAAGSLNMYFLISYSVLSPLMGWAGDRMKRTYLLAAGVGLWSLATVGTGFARDFDDLRLARSILGIGEATYVVLPPPILMDLFSRRHRARRPGGAAFFLAMPLGYALGVGARGLHRRPQQGLGGGDAAGPLRGVADGVLRRRPAGG